MNYYFQHDNYHTRTTFLSVNTVCDKSHKQNSLRDLAVIKHKKNHSSNEWFKVQVLKFNYIDFLAKYQSTISKSLLFLSAKASTVFGAGTITLSPGCQSKGIATLCSSEA